jgi:hypothetical protein
MTENNKGRRFIITVKTWDHVIFKVLFNKFVKLSPENDFKDGERVDVIEFYAYQQALDEITKLKAENIELKETISYLPKIPTLPYEKQMGKKIFKLTEALRKVRDALDEIALIDDTDYGFENIAIRAIKEIDEVLK